MLACTVAFVFDVMSGGALGADLAFSTTHGPLHMGLGLLTSALAHVDPIHLLGNMYFLYAFGRLLERRTGTEVILPLFASSAILASLAFWAVHLGQDAAPPEGSASRCSSTF